MIFPYSTEIELDKNIKASYQDVLHYIWPLLTEERRHKISKVAYHRNFNLRVILENIYDRGNISAVMRSQEAFGFGGVDIIEGGERFKNANRVSSGAEKWLHIRKWEQSLDCWKALKDEGFQVCVTSLESSKPMDQINWNKPTAIVLGNEKEGVSKELIERADERFVIPMVGFVQSFNISVAGAVCLYHVYQQLSHKNQVDSSEKPPFITKEQVEILKAYYALKTLDTSFQILRSHLQKTDR